MSYGDSSFDHNRAYISHQVFISDKDILRIAAVNYPLQNGIVKLVSFDVKKKINKKGDITFGGDYLSLRNRKFKNKLTHK
jgi:hypothetical protein